METIGATQGALTPAIIGATREGLREARNRILLALNDEVQYRMAIYRATGDAELAAHGYEWAKEPGIDWGDPVEVFAALAGEVGKGLHGAAVVIPEALYRHMIEQPGLPVWTHRNPNGGFFYVAEAWAIEEASGIDLSELISEIMVEALRYVR